MRKAFFEKHPIVNIVYFLSIIILSMLFVHPVFIVISFCGAFAGAARFKGGAVIKSFFTFLLPLFLLVTVFNTVLADYGETVLFTVWSKAVTFESAAYGAAMGSTVITLILWFMCFSQAVTEEKIMFLFGRKMPSTAMLIMIVFRFIPLYVRHFSESTAARTGMGMQSGERWTDKLKNAAVCASGVINRSLENSIETADSMKARGYGLDGRTSYSKFVFTVTDGILLSAELVLTAVVAAFKAAGTAYASYNPTVEIGEVSFAAAAAFALLCFLPLIIDFAESVKWNRLYAKI